MWVVMNEMPAGRIVKQGRELKMLLLRGNDRHIQVLVKLHAWEVGGKECRRRRVVVVVMMMREQSLRN